MTSTPISGLLRLPVEERAELAMVLWESLSEKECEGELELTPEQEAELDRRWAEHLENASRPTRSSSRYSRSRFVFWSETGGSLPAITGGKFMTGKLRLLCLVTVLAGMVGCRSVSTDGPPEGFTSLFNGHDLTGWTYDGSGNWRVESGLLVYDGQGWKPAPDTISTQNLRTEKEYNDFILLIDWKIAKGGNSGIVLRPDYEDYHEFEEVQVEIWDRTSEAYSSPLGSGGIVGYNVEERKPLRTADHPVGEWNHFEISLENDLVTVHLNDQLVIDRFAAEFKRSPGPIVLEHHGPPLWFRNIYLKELN